MITTSEAAAAMGRKKSPGKAEGGRRGGAAYSVPLESVPCTCGKTDGTHKYDCKYRRAKYNREAYARRKRSTWSTDPQN